MTASGMRLDSKALYDERVEPEDWRIGRYMIICSDPISEKRAIRIAELFDGLEYNKGKRLFGVKKTRDYVKKPSVNENATGYMIVRKVIEGDLEANINKKGFRPEVKICSK